MGTMARAGLGCPKPGIWNFFQVSEVDTGAQGLGPFSTAFPGTLAGTWMEQVCRKPSAVWDGNIEDNGIFTRYITTPGI